MKRCPECGRDYNDDSLSFCLDDGTELLFGPGDEPATAVFGVPPSGGSSSESPTRIHHSEEQPRESLRDLRGKQSFSAHRAAEPQNRRGLLLTVSSIAVLVLLGVGFGYWYFVSNPNQIESIAVMPFVNESGNPDIEYLSDGMTETLIKSLSAIPNLAVKSRSTVFFYKGKETTPKNVGEDLGVQAVLLGRVAGRGEDLKVSLELVNTKTQDVIWAEQYDRKQSDVVSLQSEIAKDVSVSLRAKLNGSDEARVTKPSTNNPNAYQAYLKGRYHLNRRTAEDLKKSIEQFTLATEWDPNFALAFSGLADCYAIYSDYAGTPALETSPQAKAYAERAVALDHQLAEPHATLGILNVQAFQWEDALRESKRAVELNPNYPTGIQWYGSILLDTGKYDEAAEMIKRAHELDPVSGAISDALSNVYQVQNNLDGAIENSRKFINLDPTFAASYRNLGFYYSKLGRHSEAISICEQGAVLSNKASWLLGDLGYIYAAAGERQQAAEIAHELESRYEKRKAAGRFIAAVYVGLGQKERAMEWLEKDFRSKNGRLAEIRWTIPFESLHGDPTFQDLLKRMGLPPV